MKLVSKPSKHSAKPTKTSFASAAENVPMAPEFDPSYLDDMIADILGTKPASKSAKKAAVPTKTEAPARIDNSAKPANDAYKPEPARHPSQQTRATDEYDRKASRTDEDDSWFNPFTMETEHTESSQKRERRANSFDWELDKTNSIDEATGLIDFGDPEENRRNRKASKKEKKKKRSFGARLRRLIITLLVLAGMYLFFVYTNIPAIASLRDAYIETAMSTMSHQWMAEWFFPDSVIQKVVNRVETAQQAQEGMESKWDKKTDKDSDKNNKNLSEEEQFYELFWEIDRETFEDYLKDHPEVLADGWDKIYINEAGIDDNGTSIWTTTDEQVLAVDAENEILLIRVEGSGYQGVLAVAKDPSRLSCTPAQNVGSYGEHLEDIMKRTDSILGMTGSGFIDENGNGNGGEIVGYALCEGKSYGTQVGYPYKRIELRKDNLLYVVDSSSPVNSEATDAVEFAPALVIDGTGLVDQLSGYTSINPRACIGQSSKGEILMLVIEGRLPTRSFGCGLPECTEILLKHDAYQAMNLDGGTSAIMWYNGEYVIKCSNTNITCRTLPNAWIYAKQPLD